MKVTRLGDALPRLSSGYGFVSQIPPSGEAGQVVTSNGSNGAYWGENVARLSVGATAAVGPFVALAAGSNTTLAVSSNTITIHGAAGGVTGITANGSNSVTGAVNLAAGTGISLAVAAQTITISATDGGGGDSAMVLLEQHTASASATLDFTTCITATYDTYMVQFIGIIPATDGAVPYIRFSTNGGSTYDTTTIYHWASRHISFSTLAVAGTGNATQGQIAIFADSAGGGVDSGGLPSLECTMWLRNPLSTSNHKFLDATGHALYNSGAGIRYGFTTTGEYRSTTAVNAFRFLFSTGNITAGTVRVYGIVKT